MTCLKHINPALSRISVLFGPGSLESVAHLNVDLQFPLAPLLCVPFAALFVFAWLGVHALFVYARECTDCSTAPHLGQSSWRWSCTPLIGLIMIECRLHCSNHSIRVCEPWGLIILIIFSGSCLFPLFHVQTSAWVRRQYVVFLMDIGLIVAVRSWKSWS